MPEWGHRGKEDELTLFFDEIAIHKYEDDH
jgi:hypothetical protein